MGEHFVVKHYTADAGPTIKGNGFDGLRVGDDREDAEEFVKWVNNLLDRIAAMEVHAVSKVSGSQASGDCVK